MSARWKATMILLMTFAMTAFAVAPASAQASVVRGDFATFATGLGDPAYAGVGGHAQMVRTADGTTIVKTHVTGLAANTAYGVHVHQGACGTNAADGHYRFDPAGPASPPNELWPAFTTDAAGVGNGMAMADQVAGPNAVSVVVHAPGGAKIACADLA